MPPYEKLCIRFPSFSARPEHQKIQWQVLLLLLATTYSYSETLLLNSFRVSSKKETEKNESGEKNFRFSFSSSVFNFLSLFSVWISENDARIKKRRKSFLSSPSILLKVIGLVGSNNEEEDTFFFFNEPTFAH